MMGVCGLPLMCLDSLPSLGSPLGEAVLVQPVPSIGPAYLLSLFFLSSALLRVIWGSRGLGSAWPWLAGWAGGRSLSCPPSAQRSSDEMTFQWESRPGPACSLRPLPGGTWPASSTAPEGAFPTYVHTGALFSHRLISCPPSSLGREWEGPLWRPLGHKLFIGR